MLHSLIRRSHYIPREVFLKHRGIVLKMVVLCFTGGVLGWWSTEKTLWRCHDGVKDPGWLHATYKKWNIQSTSCTGWFTVSSFISAAMCQRVHDHLNTIHLFALTESLWWYVSNSLYFLIHWIKSGWYVYRRVCQTDTCIDVYRRVCQTDSHASCLTTGEQVLALSCICFRWKTSRRLWWLLKSFMFVRLIRQKW